MSGSAPRHAQRVRTAGVMLLAVAISCACSQPTHAQPRPTAPESEPNALSEPAPPAEYERLVQLGFAEFEAANYAEARSRFSDAHAIYPNARVLRALGKAEYELKNYAAAVRAFEAALAHAVRALNPQQRADTERTLAEARRYLVQFTINTRPRDADVLLDGQSLVREADGRVVIPVGDHVLEVRQPGYHTARRVLHVLGGADQVVTVVLTPVAVAQTSAQPRPLHKQWWLWTTVGIVAAAGATTATLLLTRDPGETPFHKSTTGLIVNLPGAGGAQ